MEYKKVNADRIQRQLFNHFIRRQYVTRCWRKRGNKWRIEDYAFVDDWDEADYQKLLAGLQQTLAGGGVVFGAFDGGYLKGFASLEEHLFGEEQEYIDLSKLYVSRDLRSHGIGKELFRLSKVWAKAHGAQKLYISANSAEESMAFYQAMGCVEAREYNEAHVKDEPSDCQLECLV